MFQRLILNTANPGKLEEFDKLLAGFPMQVLEVDCEETGTTFEENALIKARAVAERHGKEFPKAVFVAEDSGLEIPELNGYPGVYSKRAYAFNPSENGELVPTGLTEPPDVYRYNNQKLLKLLRERGLFATHPKGVPGRYVSVIAFAAADGTELALHRGECQLRIVEEIAEENGFSYDYIIRHDTVGHFGKIPLEEKNRVSHRAEAVRRAAGWMKSHS